MDPDLKIKSDNDGWTGVIILIIVLGLLVYCAKEFANVAKVYRNGEVFVGHGSTHYHAICACLRALSKE